MGSACSTRDLLQGAPRPTLSLLAMPMWPAKTLWMAYGEEGGRILMLSVADDVLKPSSCIY